MQSSTTSSVTSFLVRQIILRTALVTSTLNLIPPLT